MGTDQTETDQTETDQIETDQMETVIMRDPETGEESEFYVLEQTCIGGISYVLVAENLEEESLAYILKEIQTEDEDVIYEVVTDDVELKAIEKVFLELMDDIEFV